ncbi:MAG: protein-glutamate O-methyltransferase CheR [Firmicutes bacterium]|jgi:chemotaxis protein methyltransferase CheR|nr:protein-glutamate O-methyltransferase CheR [Bacillota bacterium]
MVIKDDEFKRLYEFMKSNYGLNFSDEKKSNIENRLRFVMLKNEYKSFTEYFDNIKMDSSGQMKNELINRLTTNHTYFFRENSHFSYFEEIILPELFEIEKKSRDLRIWSAGCSTGEEPYTLAMILHKNLEKIRLTYDVKVLGTDISTKVLKLAKEGRYGALSVKDIPIEYKSKYFKAESNGVYQIHQSVMDEVIFRRFNLMDHFNFKKKFHVIFCRNVLIYFDNETKLKILRKFYDSLEDGGYLFLGKSEFNLDKRFTFLKPAIYRKGELWGRK